MVGDGGWIVPVAGESCFGRIRVGAVVRAADPVTVVLLESGEVGWRRGSSSKRGWTDRR